MVGDQVLVQNIFGLKCAAVRQGVCRFAYFVSTFPYSNRGMEVPIWSCPIIRRCIHNHIFLIQNYFGNISRMSGPYPRSKHTSRGYLEELTVGAECLVSHLPCNRPTSYKSLGRCVLYFSFLLLICTSLLLAIGMKNSTQSQHFLPLMEKIHRGRVAGGSNCGYRAVEL